jgi:putative transposase
MLSSHDPPTPLPEHLPALWLARAARSRAGGQQRRVARPAPPGRGAAPPRRQTGPSWQPCHGCSQRRADTTDWSPPDTLLGWHQALVGRHWAKPHRPPGRPSLTAERPRLIVRTARENPTWGTAGSAANSRGAVRVSPGGGLCPPRPQPAGVRLLARRHGAAQTPGRPGGHRGRQPPRPPAWGDDQPDRRRDHPAGPPPADGVGRPPQAVQVPHRRPGRQVHRPLRCGHRRRGRPSLRAPVRAPRANALAERWVATVRGELLDRMLLVGRRQVATVLTA